MINIDKHPATTVFQKVGLLLASFTLVACDSPIVEDFKSVFSVIDAISEVAEADQVSVTIRNGVDMVVVIANSPLNELSTDDRAAVARRIALVGIESYAHPDAIEHVQLSFVSVEKKYLVVTYTQMIDLYRFSSRELQELRGNAQSSQVLPKPATRS